MTNRNHICCMYLGLLSFHKFSLGIFFEITITKFKFVFLTK